MAGRSKPYPEVARERISAAKALSNLEWVESEIRSRLSQIDLGEVPALRLYADIQMRKLSKVLPDLKAVDHSGQLSIEQTITIKVGG